LLKVGIHELFCAVMRHHVVFLSAFFVEQEGLSVTSVVDGTGSTIIEGIGWQCSWICMR